MPVGPGIGPRSRSTAARSAWRARDGEQTHVLQLAQVGGSASRPSSRSFGQLSDQRVLLLAAIMLADQLMQTVGPRPIETSARERAGRYQ
jgi:cell division protein ZapA (FtsZ GTPase activity inhibitor)